MTMPYSSDLYYQTYQPNDLNRQPLALIHGAGGNRLSWPGNLRRLSGWRVYTPDLPGHGKSRGHGLQRVPDYGQAAAAWIRSLELPGIFLAGHSLGGAVALWLAVNHPELIRGLVLISTGARLPVNSSLLEELANPGAQSAVVDRICGWSCNPAASATLVKGIRRAMLDTRPAVLEGDFRACDAFDLGERLPEISIPTLILVGELDRMTPLNFSEELAAGIPGAELEVIPGAGHMLPLEAPELVEDRLRAFLERIGGEDSIA